MHFKGSEFVQQHESSRQYLRNGGFIDSEYKLWSFLIVFAFSLFRNEIILSELFVSNFAFPLFLKKPVRFSCRFPRFNQIAAVKESNHSHSFYGEGGRR